MRRFIDLLLLGIRVHIFEMTETLRVLLGWEAALHPKGARKLLLKIHWQLFWRYFGFNPYKLVERQFKGVPELSDQPYGETPISTLAPIFHELELKKEDVIFDLGCGRGKILMWLAATYKCRCVGIDMHPVFIGVGRQIAQKLGLARTEFLQKNILSSSLDEATVIYIYGSAFSDAYWEKIGDKLQGLKAGVQVLSVSRPLRSSQGGGFVVKKVFDARFPWGATRIYWQVAKDKDGDA
jgi:SAM-dependent methyltransferase